MSRKKSFTPTIIFGVIIAALVIFSLYDYKKSKQEKGLGENEQKLLTLTEGEVVEIGVHSKKVNLQLKSDGGSWHLLEPLKDDAEDIAITGLLNALKEAKVQTISDDDKKNAPVNWAQYGLDPGVEIQIATDQNKKDSFKLSDSNAYDGSFYVRKRDQLLIGDRSLARMANIDVKSFRSHLIWRTKGDITKTELQYTYMNEPRHVVLTKGEKEWTIDPKFDLPLSQQNVKDWLQSIRDLRANDIVADEITPKTIDQFLLKKTVMTMKFKVANSGHDEDVSWNIGQEKNNQIYVTSSALPEVFKSSKFSLREIRIPAEELLDGNQALTYPLEQAHEVDIVADGKSSHVVKGDHAWDKLTDFFQKLKNLEPIAAEPPAGVVWDAKKNHLTIKSKDGVLLDLIWSDVKDQLRWLKISNFKERFKVSAERMNALIKATQ